MTWFLIIILAYFFLAIASLFDRYLLVGPFSNPGAYAFFVGFFGGLSLLLLPFGFIIPAFGQIILSLLTGAVWTLALFLFYWALSKSEASRVVPAIGGLLPLFTFLISSFVFPQQIEIDIFYSFAFLFLISGSVLIVLGKEKSITFRNLSLSALAALAFALGFILSKLVYLQQPFISGFVWIRIGGALAALFFLFSSQVRQAVFKQKQDIKKQVPIPLILGQICGSFGAILQNYSIFLAEIGQIPIINALEGIRYIFLLFFILILSRKFPRLLKEEVSKQTLLQKSLAILFISAGLILLAQKYSN